MTENYPLFSLCQHYNKQDKLYKLDIHSQLFSSQTA